MFGRHFSEFARHARFFEKGDLKYVILDLLKDKPAHGYEIIRALEERFHGFYSPSAGSVYPTLQLLEDMGYVKSTEQDGKRVYTITDTGRSFLTERRDTVDRIKSHMRDWWGAGRREEFREGMEEFREAMHELQDMVKLTARRAHRLDREKLTRIRKIIGKAYHDIESVVEEERQQ